MNRLERYESRTSVAMTLLALVFFVAYAVPVISPGIDPALIAVLRGTNFLVWVVFAVDLAVRLRLSPSRRDFVARHPIDVLTVVLPMLRPLRVLRIFTAGQSVLSRRGGLARTGQRVLLSVAVLVVTGALAVLDAERDAPGASIVSFGDALWWGMTTVTTVGYGDLYPVTSVGRVVAVLLMIVGISAVGGLTATVAAWFQTSRAGRFQPPAGTDAADDDADRAADGDGGTPDDDASAEASRNALAALAALHAAGTVTDDELTTLTQRVMRRR